MTRKIPKRARSRRLSAAEEKLWRAVVTAVHPLADRRPPPPPEQSPPAAKTVHSPLPERRRENLPVTPPPDAETDKVAPVSARQAIPGLDRRTQENLRKGRLKIDGRLDLHGMTQAEAYPALEHFLGDAEAAGKRCVLVITGKGQASNRAGPNHAATGEPYRLMPGVLRRMLPLWLDGRLFRGRILGHTPAIPKDGGDGARYILLRRRR